MATTVTIYRLCVDGDMENRLLEFVKVHVREKCHQVAVHELSC